MTILGNSGIITYVLETRANQSKKKSGNANGFLREIKNKIKKLLTKSIAYDNINKLSMRQQQRTLKTEQYVKP